MPAILNESGEELEGPNEGYLVRIIIIIIYIIVSLNGIDQDVCVVHVC